MPRRSARYQIHRFQNGSTIMARMPSRGRITSLACANGNIPSDHVHQELMSLRPSRVYTAWLGSAFTSTAITSGIVGSATCWEGCTSTRVKMRLHVTRPVHQRVQAHPLVAPPNHMRSATITSCGRKALASTAIPAGILACTLVLLLRLSRRT